MVCLSNIPGLKERYLIFGVDNNGTVVGLNSPINEEHIQSAVYSAPIAGGCKPSFHIERFHIGPDEKLVDVIVIQHSPGAPFYFYRQYEHGSVNKTASKLKKWSVY